MRLIQHEGMTRTKWEFVVCSSPPQVHLSSIPHPQSPRFGQPSAPWGIYSRYGRREWEFVCLLNSSVHRWVHLLPMAPIGPTDNAYGDKFSLLGEGGKWELVFCFSSPKVPPSWAPPRPIGPTDCAFGPIFSFRGEEKGEFVCFSSTQDPPSSAPPPKIDLI